MTDIKTGTPEIARGPAKPLSRKVPRKAPAKPGGTPAGKRSGKRDKLLDTAIALFCKNGFHASGIDRILKESGVAKMTLYNHFRSKDDLILAALRRYDETGRKAFVKAVEKMAPDPRGRMLAFFDIVDNWVQDETFLGCPFVNAASEFHDKDHPAHRVAAEHKRLLGSYMARLAGDAGAGDPDALARQLMLLYEGAVNLAHVAGDRGAARSARTAAAVLIDHAVGRTAS